MHIFYRFFEDIAAGAYIVWVYANPFNGRLYYGNTDLTDDEK